MLILFDPDTLLHETVELLGAKIIPALDSPARISAIVESVSSHPDHTLKHVQSPLKSGSESDLKRLFDLTRQTHDRGYLKHLGEAFRQWREAGLIGEDESILPECFVFASRVNDGNVERLQPPSDIFARPGFYAFDMSSGIMKHTDASIIASANLAIQGIDRLMDTDIKDVLVLCRPPGHHCNGSKSGGYCYVNNAAVAISAFRERKPNASITILDLDFHHGNGTQDIFYDDPRVFYASIHGQDEFPYYTGGTDETGSGEAVGMNINLPLPKGSSLEEYQSALNSAMEAIAGLESELLVVSLGFDTFRLDPLGSFDIDTKDYEVVARTVRQNMSDTPALILLEGGYSIEHLGENLLSFLRGWQSAM